MPRSPPRSTSTVTSPSRTPARRCRPRAGSPDRRCGCDRPGRCEPSSSSWPGCWASCWRRFDRSSASRSTSRRRTIRCSVVRRARCPAVTGRAGSTGCAASHQNRWRDGDGPELAGFLADPGPPLNGRIELTHCTVPGCRFGSSGSGLCMRHRSAWTASGHPDPAAWAADDPARRGSGSRRVRAAVLHVVERERAHLFCKSHETRWRQQGRPAVEDYVDHCLLRGRARIDFCGLAPLPRLELQYAVQCRVDQQTITAAATGGELGDRPGQRRRRGLAARSPRGAWRAIDRGRRRAAVSGVRRCTPTTSWTRCTRAPAGRSSTRATSGGCTPARADPQHRQGPRRRTTCGSTGSPSPGYAHWPSAGPGCDCRPGSPWAPWSPTSRR